MRCCFNGKICTEWLNFTLRINVYNVHVFCEMYQLVDTSQSNVFIITCILELFIRTSTIF